MPLQTQFPITFMRGRQTLALLDRIYAAQPDDLVAVWLTDTALDSAASGGAKAFGADGAEITALNGTHTGTTLGESAGTGVLNDGTYPALYDGVDDVTNLLSTALNNAVTGAEITIVGWFKLTGTPDAGDRIYSFRGSPDNQDIDLRIQSATSYQFTAAFVSEQVTIDPAPTDRYVPFAFTRSENDNEAKYYVDKVLVNTDIAEIAWTGTTWSRAFIAAVTASPSLPAPVTMQYFAIWNAALNADTLANMWGDE